MSMQDKRSLAILLAYNGTLFAGLERKQNEKTVEGVLFKAFPADTVSITHISRASLTAPGQHAARQVISLTVTGPTLPTAESLNAALETNDIIVFKVLQVHPEFSARRTCEARTIECLLPTYAFAPPPESTHYCLPEMDNDGNHIDDAVLPKGGLFEESRYTSLQKRATFVRRGDVEVIKSKIKDDSIDASAIAAKERMNRKVVETRVPEKKKGFSLFVENFAAMFKPKKNREVNC